MSLLPARDDPVRLTLEGELGSAFFRHDSFVERNRGFDNLLLSLQIRSWRGWRR